MQRLTIPSYVLYLLAATGVVTAATTMYKMLSFAKLNFFTSCDMKAKYGKAGNWAVVTGASEGIGHAMSLELARRGFNVCAIARTKSKLDALVADIQKLGVEGLAVSFDFASATPQSWAELFAQLDKLAIAVLVNNVGVNYTFPEYFEAVDVEKDLWVIKVNCESATQMTKYVLPKMKAARAGAIVMLASFSAVSPVPLLGTYAGTKAYNLSFGEALHYETKEFGVDVLTVTPNLVVSKMTQGASSRLPRETFVRVNADAMAHQTLNKIGKTVQTAGHWHHCLIEAIVCSLPINFISNKVLAFHKNAKRRADKKKVQPSA